MRWFGISIVVSAVLLASGVAFGAGQKAFVEGVEFNRSIPTPESIIGFEVGARAVRYDALVEYLKALAAASDKVILTPYGTTHEGRKLYYLTITSRANQQRLDRIRTQNAKLSDPRRLSEGEQKKLINNMPAVAWMDYSIHGDELSSTDAAVYVAYHLAAATDEATRKILDEVVVHINPLVNPDGRQRYLSYLEQLTGAVSSPDYQSMQHQALWSRGRGNHYLLDLNRDWPVHTQPEVRPLAAEILKWNPHLLIDSHEQNAYDTYLFDPPREPVSIQLSQTVLDWRKHFGREQAKAFNRYGWSYYTKEWYSDWGPMYTNSWASLLGSVGLLYEQARVNQASIKYPTGQVIGYRETVRHHIVSSLANLQTLRANRRRILSDFLADRRWAVDEDTDADIFLLPVDEDSARWGRLVKLIAEQGIEAQFAAEPFEARNVTDLWGERSEKKAFAKGTLVVKSKQPHRRLLHALFDFDPHMQESFLVKERRELEHRRQSKIYDVTTWNLPMTSGLECCRAKEISDVKLTSKPVLQKTATSKPAKSGYGYLIDFGDSDVYAVLVRLFEKRFFPRIANKPFEIAGRRYRPGTVLLRGNENPDSLYEILTEVQSQFGIGIFGVDSALSEQGPDLGGQEFVLLAEPKVAIASQWPVRTTSFGSVWYLLDNHIRLRCSPVNIQSVGRLDLRKYNVLILPDARGLGRVVEAEDVQKIRRWVEGGGTLICIGGSAAFAADKERGLSAVRLRRDVLDKLDEYKEAIQHEKDAKNVRIDANEIWAGPAATEPNAACKKAKEQMSEKSSTKDDIDKLKRTDKWRRIFSPKGTFVKSVVDTEQWLGFGLDERLAVMFMGERTFMSKYPVFTPVRLAEKEKLRLSGLLWPEARERIADSAFVTVEKVGRGQIILFATDPTFRCWLGAEQRLFFNAVLLGPGMGTSQPMPW